MSSSRHITQRGYIPKYSQWLQIWPVFPGPNRILRFAWRGWNGRVYDLASVSSRYREALLLISQRERAMIEAAQRRDRSLAHELQLNTYRAFALQTSLENMEFLLPFRQWEAETSEIVALFRTMPPRLSQHFYKIRRPMQDLSISLPGEINDLKKLRELRWNIVHGSSVRTLRMLHEIFSLQDVHRNFKREQGRILRSHVKDRGKGSVPSAHMNEYEDIERRLRMLRARDTVEQQIISVLERDRIQYAKFGLFGAILIVLTRLRKTRKLLYHVTAFPLHRARNATPTKSDEFHAKWFAIFRTTLDAWEYETPGVRRTSLSINSLLLDWTAIMDYKISRRPDLVTDRHVEKGKHIYLAALKFGNPQKQAQPIRRANAARHPGIPQQPVQLIRRVKLGRSTK